MTSKKPSIYAQSVKDEVVKFLENRNGKPASMREIYANFLYLMSLPILSDMLMEMVNEGMINRFQNGETTVYTAK